MSQIQRQCSNGVVDVAVSPDGKLLATAGDWWRGDGGVTLWEIESKKLMAVPETNDASGCLSFSPDGQWLAFGTGHHGTRLWDIARSREAHHFPGNQPDFGEEGVAFSPDGRLLAADQEGGTITLWDVGTKTPFRVLKVGADTTSWLAFLPDGQTLVAAGKDSTNRLWSVTSGQQVGYLVTPRGTFTHQLAVSPDGRTLAAADSDCAVRVWDLKEKRHVMTLTNSDSAFFPWKLAYSPEGKRLACAGRDQTIRVWNTTNWEEVTTLRGSLHEVWCVAFAPDGKTLFSGAKDGAIKSWDVTQQPRNQAVFDCPDDATFLQTYPGSGLTLVAHSNGTYTVWDPRAWRSLGPYPKPPAAILTNTLHSALSPKAERLALATRQGLIVLWDLLEGRQITNLVWIPRPPAGDPGVGSYALDRAAGAFSPDGTRLCFAGTNRLTVWNLETFEELASLPKSVTSPASGPILFSDDNQAVALANSRSTVEVWNLALKEHIGPWKAHIERVSAIAFLPGNQRLLTSSFDTTLKLWDLKTLTVLRRFGRTENKYLSVAVSPDLTRVAGGAGGSYIRMWNFETSQEVARIRTTAPSHYLGFLGDGNTLVSASDQEVRLWRAPTWAEIDAAEKPTGRQAQ